MSEPTEWNDLAGDDSDDDLNDDMGDPAITASEDVECSSQVIGSSDISCSTSIYFSTGIVCCAATLFCVDITCMQFVFCNRQFSEEDWQKKLADVLTILEIGVFDSDHSFDEYWDSVTNLMWFELLELDGVDSSLLAEVSGFDEMEILAKAGMGFQEKLISIGAILSRNE